LPGRRTLAQAEQQGVELGKSLNAPTIAAMRRLSPERLLEAKASFWPLERDGYVLPDEVYDTFAKGGQNRAGLIAGSNANEVATLPMVWVKPESEAEKATYASLYARPGGLQATNDTVLWQMRTWVRLDARTGGPAAYSYLFDHAWPAPDGKPDPRGAFHGGEIIYVFDNLDRTPLAWTAQDRRLADLMSDYWTNFAKRGDPNGPGLPHWPAYDVAHEQTMLLSDGPHAIDMPHARALEFLDAYFASRRHRAVAPPTPSR
jgi:para-nitrobenzyl esterase